MESTASESVRRWACGCGESAAGGREARAGDADRGRWSQLPLHQWGEWASGCGESGVRELVLTRDGGFSCLYVSGHLDVVEALLEAGGRELVMLTKGDGASCHYVSVENGHVDVVRACWQKRRRVLPHSPVPALPLKRQLIVPLESAQRRRDLIVFEYSTTL